MSLIRNSVMHTALVSYTVFASTVSLAEPQVNDILAVMKKTTDFMTNTVSNHGGYLSQYSEDLSQQWGEIPARKTQILVQPPGTTTVGMMYLEAYKVTGNSDYLDYAQRAAHTLIYGQHPEGGWHYIIDFDMPGLQKWYDECVSTIWGWEEYEHYYGNCTYDDSTTSAPTRFLLELYMLTLDPKYRVPLIKALNFILESQYPNGAWPQRYPLKDDYPHDGHADYTSYYTFNDGVIRNNITLLYEAYEKLGDEEYRNAAVRGMDFYRVSQLPYPQAGWAQQYTMDMKPGWGRSFEPDAVNTSRTVTNIYDLMKFYTMTGDKRYLTPIPGAIEWIENSVINSDPSKKWTHAGFYELGTNKPLYYHVEGTGISNHRHWVDHDITNSWWYRRQHNLNSINIRRDYERFSRLTPKEAKAEYETEKEAQNHVHSVDSKKVEEIISSLDKRGAWITDMRIPHYNVGMLNLDPNVIRGIDIGVYVTNMNTLINYLKSINYSHNK